MFCFVAKKLPGSWSSIYCSGSCLVNVGPRDERIEARIIPPGSFAIDQYELVPEISMRIWRV